MKLEDDSDEEVLIEGVGGDFNISQDDKTVEESSVKFVKMN